MKKINIADLLKDCPSGMELNCTSYDNVSFDKISDDKKATYPIFCYITDKEGNRSGISFTENGCESKRYGAKCVIFPKGKTTWEGFQRPFKDGDIVAGDNRACSYITIFREFIDNTSFSHHVCLTSFGKFKVDGVSDNANLRFATEEEKRKLFDAIKEKGFHWNEETKTLEKLVEPKFKVGDIIHDVDYYKVQITEINEEEELYIYCSVIAKGIGAIPFEEQDNWKLVPNKFDITTLVPFESKVLVRDKNNEKWLGQFFSHYDNGSDRPYVCIGIEGLCEYKKCIPFKNNEYLLGKTDDCDEYYKTW